MLKIVSLQRIAVVGGLVLGAASPARAAEVEEQVEQAAPTAGRVDYSCLAERSLEKNGVYEVVDSKAGSLITVEASKYGDYGLKMQIDGFWLGAMAVLPPVDLLRVDVRNLRNDGSPAGAVAQASISSRSVSTTLFTATNEIVTFTCSKI